MLHLTGGVGLGVQVADLFELERALVGNSGTHATAHEQRRLRVLAQQGGLMHGLGLGIQNPLDLLGRIGKLAEQHARLLGGQAVLDLRQQQSQKRKAHDLADEALGRGDRDLLVGLGVDDAVALTRHGAAHHVGDAEDLGTLDARIANGGKGIGRLARLGHGNDKRRRRNDGVAITELAGRLHLGGDASPALDEILGNEASVIAGAASDHVDAVDVVELLERKAQLVDVELAGRRHTTDQRVAHDARLLVNLLEHKVGITALFCHVQVPVDVGDLGLDNVAGLVGVLDACGRKLGKLTVLEHHDIAGGVDERDDVGGDIGAGLARADHDRGILAGHGDHAGLVSAHDGQTIGTDHVGASLAHGGHQVVRLGISLFDQMREDLGIGLALKVVAAALQLFAQLGEVLDDAVVDDGDTTVAAGVGVSVNDGGLAVGGPTGVADTAGSVAVDVGKLALQARDLAHAADDVEVRRGALAHLERDARGVIAAILHTLEACDQDVLCNIRAGVADNSAHRINPFVRLTAKRPRTGGAETHNVRVLYSRKRKLIYQKWYLNLNTTRYTHPTPKGAGTFVVVWSDSIVCPDKTCQNKPVPNRRVLTPQGRAMLQSGLYLKRIKGAAMAKVKISDVAREAGVSLGTVSNALNHPEKLRPETLKLINETINRLGYLPNQSARQLAGGATKSFGLVLPRLDHGFSLQIASGAHNEARKHGYDLLIANADNDDILEDHYLRYFMGTQMSGVMVQPMASPDWHPALTKMPVPIVHLDIHCSEPGYYVAADNEAQGRIIAELAIARGAHHIVVVGRAAFMQLTLRVLGIHKALALHPDIKIEVIDAGEWNTAADGYGIGTQIAARPADERPDFVVGLTDVLASGVISALVDKGIAVPGQVRVAGCDGNPLAWSGSVPLTTVAPPGYEIGRKGVQLLMEQIENKAPAKTKHIRVGSTARTVTAVTAAEDINRQELVRPFLLERASTQASSQTDATAINLGAYL